MVARIMVGIMSKAITSNEAIIEVARTILDGTASTENDNQGQVIIYTGIYEWEDESLHYEPEKPEDE